LVIELFDLFFTTAMATNNGNQQWHCDVDPIYDKIFFPLIVLILTHPFTSTLFILHILFKVFSAFKHKQEYSPSAAVDRFSPKLFSHCMLQVIGLTVIGWGETAH
jgi:hypothetical protein